MIAIIDYGVGNLSSLQNSFSAIGEPSIITNSQQTIKSCDRLLLPGVGAFPDAVKMLKESGLFEVVKDEVRNGKKLLGVCLGMQMLFEKSYEYGENEGLGLLKGEVVPMKGRIRDDLKIPHMGWNSLHMTRDNELLRYISEGDYVYFVHSFFADRCDDSLIAYCDYGGTITAVVAKDNVYGCQFHPEKSGTVGLKILKAFCEV